MDAIALLKADHKTVEALFKQFEKLQKKNAPAVEKKRVVGKIIKELSVHAAIEEEQLYPKVREREDELDDSVLEALEEHHIVKWTLSELHTMKPSDERYDAKVTVLMESVRHHVEEEEQELFPEVRKVFSRAELTEMGADLERLKKKVPKKPHPRSPDEPPANRVANRMTAAAEAGARRARRSSAPSTTARRVKRAMTS